jgi:hypothetical protein
MSRADTGLRSRLLRTKEIPARVLLIPPFPNRKRAPLNAPFGAELAVLTFLVVTFAVPITSPQNPRWSRAGALNGIIAGPIVYGVVWFIGWVIRGFAAS